MIVGLYGILSILPFLPKYKFFVFFMRSIFNFDEVLRVFIFPYVVMEWILAFSRKLC